MALGPTMTIASFHDFKQKRVLFFSHFFIVLIKLWRVLMHREIDPLTLKLAQTHCTANEAGLNALYRYSSYSSKFRDRHACLLKDGWLYHSKPEVFNDPFDCQYHLRWPNTNFDSEELRGYLDDVELLSGLNLGNVDEEVRLKAMSNLKNESLKKKVELALKAEYSKVRVCCFTSSHINQLFWSHYADSHKGYCVKFAVTSNPKSVISSARRINYTDDYPTLTFPLFTKLAKLISPFFVKSTNWAYEGEYRSIFNSEWKLQLENNGEALKLSNDEITDIYFGAKMSPEDKADIIELCEQGPFAPKFWDTKVHAKRFELVFVPHIT